MKKGWIFVVIPVIVVGLGVGLYFALHLAGPGGREGGQLGGQAGLPTVVAAGENTCVACHRQIPEGTLAGHSFRDWEISVHAAREVTCEACHGGDPAKGEKHAAHLGVLNSREPESKVYFQTIPVTCGRCHPAEFNRFQASIHYEQLQEEGRGPNCVTCHGSMAISILSPPELQRTCGACHNERLGIRPVEPLKARYVLIMSTQVAAYVEAVEQLARAKKATGAEMDEAEGLLAQAEQELEKMRQEWHKFSVDRIEEHLAKAFQLAGEAAEGLRDVEE